MALQDTIATLQKFWEDQKCVILQPYDMPMGAGTFHPATAIRLLQHKQWRAAYVQGCRRPATTSTGALFKEFEGVRNYRG